MTIAIYGPESDPEDIEDALEEMAELGANNIAIAVWNGEAVMATSYSLEKTETILSEVLDILRLARAH